MNKVIKFFKNEASIIFLVFLLFYFYTSAVTSPSDTIPNLFLPLNLIRGRGFYLDDLYPFFMKAAPMGVVDNLPYYLSFQKGHYISDYPVLTSVLAMPIYLLPVLVKRVTIENIYQTYKLIPVLGKLSASIFTALSVSFLYLALKSVMEQKKALILTVIYALGTSSLPISSQALWQHGASQMFLALSILFLVRGQKKKEFLGLSGFSLGLATMTRYPNIVLSLIIFAYIFFFQRKQTLRFITFFLPPLMLLLLYNWFYFGSPLMAGYERGSNTFETPLLTGVAGLLFATSKGLLVYSPIFFFSFLGIIQAWFNKKEVLLKVFSVAFIAFLLLMGKWTHWHGGWSFGPRMLVDTTPFLVILLAPVVNSKLFKKPIVYIPFYVLAAIAILIQFFGTTLAYDLSWYRDYKAEVEGLARLWRLEDWELGYYFQKAGGFIGVLSALVNEVMHIISRALKQSLIIGIVYFFVLSVRIDAGERIKKRR